MRDLFGVNDIYARTRISIPRTLKHYTTDRCFTWNHELGRSFHGFDTLGREWDVRSAGLQMFHMPMISKRGLQSESISTDIHDDLKKKGIV